MRFHSAQAQVEIEKNGEVFNRSSFPILFNSISSVKATVRHAEIMNIEITITPSFSDALLILKSGLLGFGKTDKKPEASQSEVTAKSIKPGAGTVAATGTENQDPLKNALSGLPIMYVKFSRPGETIVENQFETPWYVGAITQPDIQVSGAEITITLRGYAYGVFFCGPKYMVKVDEDTTAYGLVEDAASLLDHEVIFDSIDAETQTALKNKKLKPHMRQETPFDTIKWALAQEGCMFSIGINPLEGKEKDKKGNAILIRKLSALFNQQSKYAFYQWRNPDYSSDITQVPCFNFSIESGRSLFFNGFSFGTYRLGEDSFKKKVIVPEELKTQPITEIDPNNTTGLKADTKATLKLGRFTPVREDTEEGKSATSDIDKSEIEKQLVNFQKFAIEVPGIPNLAPMDLVDLLIGDIDEFSGKMLVTGVTHTFDSSGWNTSIEARKTGGLEKDS